MIREILVGLRDLHLRGLIHGDVKPENIMFSDKVSRNVKLIDFDTCKLWDPKASKARRFSGSPGYIAPETVLGEASPQSDLWSVGVILFIFMTGYMPFEQDILDTWVDSASSKALYEDMTKQHVDWKEDVWLNFPGAADLCRQLLEFDPLRRPKSASETLCHPWLRQLRLK